MTLKIISATGVVFEGKVDSATLPGSMGRFTVLRGHASLISTLVPGIITYRQGQETPEEIKIDGGIADVDNDVISVCIN